MQFLNMTKNLFTSAYNCLFNHLEMIILQLCQLVHCIQRLTHGPYTQNSWSKISLCTIYLV